VNVLSGHALDVGYHGTTVVHAASLTLTAGKVTALVGPNGSGKSTLLRALARLHKPTCGDVLLEDGESAFALAPKEFARRVTLLAQSRPTPTGITVRDVVSYGRYPYRSRFSGEDPDGLRAVEHALEVTGTTPMAHRPVDELSGGELQRVWLATCLAQDTGVLLLDEPTTFLDIAHQIDVLDLCADLHEQGGRTLVAVLHDLNHAARYATHLIVMSKGAIVAEGNPSDVLTEQLVTDVFGLQCQVIDDPETGTPMVIPARRRARSRELALDTRVAS